MNSDALTHDPVAITERLTELAETCHLVSPVRNVDTLPEGYAVSIDFVRVSATDSREVSESEDGKSLLLSAKKLQEIGVAAGIKFSPSESGRKGDTSDPHYYEFCAVGETLHIDGTPRACIGEISLDARDGGEAAKEQIARAVSSGRDPELELGRFRRFIHSHAETRAQARAVTNGLGLRREYSPEELDKPFAIARLVYTGRRPGPLPELPERFALSLYRGPKARKQDSFRFAVVGDTHADETRRLDEHNRIMAWIGADAAARGVDAYLHAGDVWERKSTSIERRAVADWAVAWGEHAPVVVVPGNHDDPLDVEWIGRLRSRFPIRAVTSPEVVAVPGTSAAVACVPWPRKGGLLAKLGVRSREEGNQIATEALRDVMRMLGDELSRHQGPRLLVGHCMMLGSRTTPAQPALVGHDFELTLADLAMVAASFYGLGHIHLGQEWFIGEAPVAMAGSPRRTDWGEPEAKSYIVGEFEGSRLVSWERVPTPCTPMLHVTVGFERGSIVLSNEDANLIERNPGAEIRLRYEVPVDQAVAAAAAASDLADLLKMCGAAHVKPEAVTLVEHRARAPEVAAARNAEGQLVAHWNSVGFEPGERREDLLAMARGLEAEAMADAA
ncbi:MAG TPA: metallophosphoesterase [Polyangiaceae bacterium]